MTIRVFALTVLTALALISPQGSSAQAAGRIYLDQMSAQQVGPDLAEVTLKGNLSDPCTKIEWKEGSLTGTTFELVAETVTDPSAACVAVLEPFEEVRAIPIKDLPAGTYKVRFQEHITTFQIQR